jgi:transposase
MDIQNEMFAKALYIKEPIFVEHIVYEEKAEEMHIYLSTQKGATFPCSECDELDCKVHGKSDRTWRCMDFFGHKAFLHFKTPRVKCPHCGVHIFVPPWTRKHSSFTLLFEAYILEMARHMPVSAIAKIVGEHDTRLWRIIGAHVGKAYREKDMSYVTEVGFDETSSKKGHNYVTCAYDLKEGDVLFATGGKGAENIESFVQELEKHNGSVDKITEVSIDMGRAFIAGVREFLPKAEVTFDKFHVVQHANKAVDQVRRAETKKNPLLKGSRYVWLKNPENLTDQQQKDLKTLSKDNKELARAYQEKLVLQDIYRTVKDRETAEIALKKFCAWAKRSRLTPMVKFGKLLESHWEGILHYFESGNTSGVCEGINNKIQLIKKRSRGFKNISNFIMMIYLEGSNLTLPAWG